MELKNGVTVLGLMPQMILALIAVKEEYDKYCTEVVITSGNDGHHANNSKHYTGAAIDIRTYSLPHPDNGIAIADVLNKKLGRDFDVIFEGDHIHIEFDPKRPL